MYKKIRLKFIFYNYNIYSNLNEYKIHTTK